MNAKLNKTIIVLHISAIIYLLLGIGLMFLSQYSSIMPILGIISIGMGIFVEIVVRGLKDNKYWAWIAGIIICGLYIPSLFIIFGIIGLMGLLDKEVKKNFS